MSNLTRPELVAGISVRMATILPSIAAIAYLWWRLRLLPQDREDAAGDALDETCGRILSYLAGGLLGLLFRFEFGLSGVALRWSLAMLALFVAGHLLRDADLRMQGYLLAGAVFLRAVGFDFRQGGPILGVDGPLAITVVGVLCYLTSGFLIRDRNTAAEGSRAPDRRSLALEAQIAAIGPDLLFSLAIALPAIYLYRTRSGFMLIVAWAIEGLCATAAGFAAEARALRLSGLGLLGVALALTLVKALTTFDTVGRIVSFIVLGVVLLVISFGYTHYRGSGRRAA